jgi:hypothetical protein
MKILETLGQTKTILVQSANCQHDESFFSKAFLATTDLLPPQFQRFWPSLYFKKRLAKPKQ